MKFGRVLRISRPRFWIYELGPYMIGILAGVYSLNVIYFSTINKNFTTPWGYMNFFDYLPYIIVFTIYFLVPANIWIYGINDIYDYETDKLNPKKVEGYEALVEPREQKSLWKWILLTTLPFLIILPLTVYYHCYSGGSVAAQCGFLHGYKNQLGRGAILSFLSFLFFSGQYSAKPIRAKAKPILDSTFSAGHYIATAAFGFFLVNPTGHLNRSYIIAGMARAMAMHAFSAVPDIKADTDANLTTIATLLGGRNTIILCLLLYIISAYLSYSFGGIFSIIIGVVYAGLMVIALSIHNEEKLFALYKRFPWINMLSGMGMFFTVLLQIVS